ncbi:11891_t:CDS:2 [Funneliformis geosporum]|uniref:11891_t:CDS:1 n=1 Tax=Funneliformis geosporum TaxID=1117311 RepID=A0A9W4WRX1_9GLOM|nr:11891_t:CDS:2 [Funneliformis geosporum]
MDKDVCPNNPPPKKNFEEAEEIIHLDYPQLRRAANHVNDIVEREIADGIPPERIFVAGYSQGALLTLAVALTSQHKLAGKKSYDLLKERGYNVEFKTHPGLGHIWKNEEVIEFLKKNLTEHYQKPPKQTDNTGDNNQKRILISIAIISGIVVFMTIIIISSGLTRRAHNPEIGGSNPSPATNLHTMKIIKETRMTELSFNKKTNKLLFFIKQFTYTPKIVRYKTRNYVKYPIYDGYSERTKLIRKFDKAINPIKFVNEDILELDLEKHFILSIIEKISVIPE